MSRTDAELITAFRGGDDAAFAELYDRYGDRIHTFAFTRLRDASAAGRALQTTFFEVLFRLDEVGDGEGFRPWLFGIAGRVIAVESRRSEERADGPHDTLVEDLAPDDTLAEDAARMVWAAAAGLRSHDQELLEIHVREGLDRDEISAISGVPPEHVGVMIARLKRRLEIAVGSLLAVRVGSDDCPGFDAILRGWDGRFSTAFRSEATRHIESCDACRDNHRPELDWSTIAASLPMCPAPESARAAVLAAIAEPSDALLDAASAPAGDEADGEMTGPVRSVRSSPRAALVAVAVVALVLLVAVLIGGADERSNDGNVDGPTASVTYPSSPPSTAPPTSTTATSTSTTSTTTLPVVPSTTIDPAVAILEGLEDFDLGLDPATAPPPG